MRFGLPSLDTVLSILPEPLRSFLPRPRRVQACAGGVRIELREIGGPDTRDAVEALEAQLRAAGADRAEVNGALGCVFVTCAEDTADMDRLLAVVEEYDVAPPGSDEQAVEMAEVVAAEEDEDEEETEPAGGVRWARDGVEQEVHAGIALFGGLAGTGLALAGFLTRSRRLPPTVPAFVQLVEHTPRVRVALERHVGVPATDTLFTVTRIVTQTLAVRPIALFLDSTAAAGRFADSRAGRRAWERREEEFAAHDGAYRHIRVPMKPRSAPLPHGPIERYGDAASFAALAAQGVTSVASRSQERGLAMLISGTPKAARLGRDGFASAVVQAVSDRGGIVLHRTALRRMDRIDAVLLDARVLETGGWTIEEVVPLAEGGDLDALHARLYTLLDLKDPAARRAEAGWIAEPLTGPAAEERERVARWRERGVRPIEVTRDGTRVALVGLAPELHPLAEALAAAAKGTARVFVAGGEPGLGRRLGVEQMAVGAAHLVESVRTLQREGHGVALVSRRSPHGLAEADIGIGVFRSGSSHVPWDADVIADHEGVYLLLRGLPYARKASEHSVRVTLGGAVIGAGLSTLGPAARAIRSAVLVGDATALASMVAGALVGRGIRHVVPPSGADRTPWHAMATSDVLARLDTSDTGLADEDAVQRRGIAPPRAAEAPPSLVRASVEELANPLTPVLATGAGVSAMVGSVLDAVLIAGVMVVDAVLGGAQRRDAQRALRHLTKETEVHVRLLRRGGGRGGATAEDLVQGDVIELRAGDAVPADARLLRAVGLEVDESTLTGESQLVVKTSAPTAAQAVADRTSMVYQGTTVAAGHGLAVVVAVGEATEVGRTAELGREGPPPSGVELRLRELSRRILPIALGSGALLMVIDLLRGSPAATAVSTAVSLSVAAVPEGLPFIATVAELAAAKRLSARNTLVRNPATIEALGRVDVLCFDKTGTLTEGHISLGRVSDGWTEQDVDALTPQLRAIVAAALRASPRFGGGRAIPHPTDRAVVEGATGVGITPEDGLREWKRVDEMPFEPARGYHAVLGLSETGHLLSVKGAPEIVLTRCDTVERDGSAVPLDDVTRKELTEEVDRLARQGYRVLAVAERRASSRADLDESRISRLCFLGYLGLSDPVRPTAKRSVEGLTRAGVRVVMITGDHPSTAEAIAAEVGALNGLHIMTGPQVDDLDDAALVEVLPQVSVFARVTPAHKARIVSCLRQAGKIVAVTGDGANDVPAIRLADVGVALGERATPAARSAADIVVADNRIETIIDAIVEGRAMWGSVRDSLGILLGGNVGEILFTVGSNLLTQRSALNARQLLLVNMLTDMLPAMAVAVRPPSATSPEKLLAEGPEVSLGAALTRDIYLRAGTTAVGAGLAWGLARMTGTRGRADTVGLIGLVATQLLQTLMTGGRDRTVVIAAMSSFAGLALIISVPGLSQFFGCRPIGPFGWAIGLGCSAVASALGQLIERSIAPSAIAAAPVAVEAAPALL
ncbi:cation-translocating P-type ATPase [Microtetraspora sp. NBRC 16547]|uniref:cation-translocating P-type ATPase n=1 Tax=Microtetraspora sp. NBRC 16547 TaxID=3030993 RepID=UPI0024A0DC6F|nr:cation-translocating P-type ATPase [Microtetraspora sp. NBRC 16547]GLW98615.1 haloacid dehalogenase [Microtetraspora sp. NBRC 16547]